MLKDIVRYTGENSFCKKAILYRNIQSTASVFKKKSLDVRAGRIPTDPHVPTRRVLASEPPRSSCLAMPTSDSRALRLESTRIFSVLTSRWTMTGFPQAPACGWWRYWRHQRTGTRTFTVFFPTGKSEDANKSRLKSIKVD